MMDGKVLTLEGIHGQIVDADELYAHLHQEGLTIEQAAESPMLWDPLRYVETCPASDGACAMVLTSEDVAKKGPGGKLHVTYDIARQFAGYGEKAGVSSMEFAERIIHHL